MKRFKMSKQANQKFFKRNLKAHPSNTIKFVSRGGIRK